MKFQFRLQTVFDLKKHLEKEQRDAMAAAQQKLKDLYEERDQINLRYAEWSKKYLAMAESGMSPEKAVRTGQYLDDLRKDGILATRKIEKQKEEVEKQRILLIEKMKERKTIESLYEKQKERFQFDENKKEEKALEDLITSRRA